MPREKPREVTMTYNFPKEERTELGTDLNTVKGIVDRHVAATEFVNREFPRIECKSSLHTFVGKEAVVEIQEKKPNDPDLRDAADAYIANAGNPSVFQGSSPIEIVEFLIKKYSMTFEKHLGSYKIL